MTEPDVVTAVKEFEMSAAAHTEATHRGDYRAANLNYDRIQLIGGFLKQCGQLQRLNPLLGHGSSGVRIWAATLLLNVDEGAAIATLQEIARTEGIDATNADMVLREWQAGNLKL